MKKIELTVSKLPWGARAMTLYPFILYIPSVRNDPCIQAHESYHWKSQSRWGLFWPLTWGLWYVILGFIVGYYWQPANDHPMEKKAYAIQWECERLARSGISYY